jgi:hypothetical protein
MLQRYYSYDEHCTQFEVCIYYIFIGFVSIFGFNGLFR